MACRAWRSGRHPLSARPAGRQASCGRAEALVRLRHASKFLEVAEIVESEADSTSESAGVAAALAVLAGIAACDSACCVALGVRSRGPDHRQAARLLRTITGGVEASVHLDRLLAVKDAAHYGVIDVNLSELRSALRHARALLEFAHVVMRS